MKVIAIAAILSLLMSTSSRAGMVLFDPPAITITPGTQSVSFETRAVPEMLTSFDLVNVIFGSVEGLEMSFQWDSAFPCGYCFPAAELGLYALLTNGVGHDIGVGGNNFSFTPWTNVTLGILTVDTSTLIAGDVRSVIVDSDLESSTVGAAFSVLQNSSGNQENLSGSVTITVVPEPATALGLAIGMTAIFSARRFLRKTTS